jgi:hypothetical protein
MHHHHGFNCLDDPLCYTKNCTPLPQERRVHHHRPVRASADEHLRGAATNFYLCLPKRDVDRKGRKLKSTILLIRTSLPRIEASNSSKAPEQQRSTSSAACNYTRSPLALITPKRIFQLKKPSLLFSLDPWCPAFACAAGCAQGPHGRSPSASAESAERQAMRAADDGRRATAWYWCLGKYRRHAHAAAAASPRWRRARVQTDTTR